MGLDDCHGKLNIIPAGTKFLYPSLFSGCSNDVCGFDCARNGNISILVVKSVIQMLCFSRLYQLVGR